MRNIVPILLDQKVTIKDKIRYVQYMACLWNFFLLFILYWGLACFHYEENRKDEGNAVLLIWSVPDIFGRKNKST
jgi:hypothetical protein